MLYSVVPGTRLLYTVTEHRDTPKMTLYNYICRYLYIHMCVCVCVLQGRSCQRAAPSFFFRRLRTLLRACPRRKAPTGVEHALSCLMTS